MAEQEEWLFRPRGPGWKPPDELSNQVLGLSRFLSKKVVQFNERFALKDFERGCYSALALIDELSKVKV